MNAHTISFNPQYDLNKNARVLEKVLRDEFAAGCGNFIGYRFIFDPVLQVVHKRAGRTRFPWDCYEMMRNARDERKQVRVFRNMNGELACELK